MTERLDSPDLRWGVRYHLRRFTITIIRIDEEESFEGAKTKKVGTAFSESKRGKHSHPYKNEKGKFWVYQVHFQKLLKVPKSKRDQCVVDLGLLEAFRCGEISSFHVEWCDIPNGDLWVLDSKKQVVSDSVASVGCQTHPGLFA